MTPGLSLPGWRKTDKREPLMLQGSIRDQPPKKFKIYGERCSGTNFVQSLISNNCPGLRHTRRYNWEKHNFVNPPFVRDETLAVVVVREAFDWLRSLHRSPHQVGYWYKETDFSGFLRHEWSGVFNGFLLAGQGKLGIKGAELMYERHPDTGARIANVVELRNLKVKSQLKVRNLYPHWFIVRYEDVRDDPQAFIAALSDHHGVAVKAAFSPVTKDVSNFALPQDRAAAGRERPYAEFSKQDRQFVLGALDLEQEHLIGYDY